jgi:hypothetical protein
MKRTIVFLFIAFAVCPNFGQSEIDINAEKEAIRAVIDKRSPDGQAASYEEESEAWAHGPQVQRFTSSGRQIGWEIISGHYKQRELNRQENPWSSKKQKSNMQYSVFGNVVLASW